ncbi:hypothetical protein Dimus_003701, partial [Dionaea muscipula]
MANGRRKKTRASSVELPLTSGLGDMTSEFGMLWRTEALEEEPQLDLDTEEEVSHQKELSHSEASIDDVDEADGQLEIPDLPPTTTNTPSSGSLQTSHEIDDKDGETLIPASDIQIEDEIEAEEGETLILADKTQVCRDNVDALPESTRGQPSISNRDVNPQPQDKETTQRQWNQLFAEN